MKPRNLLRRITTTLVELLFLVAVWGFRKDK